MITGKDHVRNLGGQRVDPLLPQIPVGLVQNTHITTLGSTLVRDFTLGQRRLVFRRNVATRELAVGAVVTDRPAVLTRQNPRVPIIRIAYITSVPSKGSSFFGGFRQFLERTSTIGVAQIV